VKKLVPAALGNAAQKPAKDQIVDADKTSTKSYKRISSQKHYCSYRCGWCDVLGKSIIEQKYRDFGNILLEDDLGYNFFGRELVK
jgi:hypothetical protein